MIGPCMCGDTACPSCGPAQGYDPVYESVGEWLGELFTDCPEPIDHEWLTTYVADKLGQDQELADALVAWARRKESAYRRERSMPFGEDWHADRVEPD